MHRFRFSLLAMFGFVAVVAVACAALARPSQLWLVVVSAASLGCLFYAVLAAAYGRSARRAFWLGFAVVGWGYVALEWANAAGLPFFLPTQLITDRLQSAIHAVALLHGTPPTVFYTSPYAATSVSPTPLGASPNVANTEPFTEPLPIEPPPVEVRPYTSTGDTEITRQIAQNYDPYAVMPGDTPYGTSIYVTNPVQPLATVDLEAFGRIAKWLWSILLGSAGGLVALRLDHRRERQDRQSAATN